MKKNMIAAVWCGTLLISLVVFGGSITRAEEQDVQSGTITVQKQKENSFPDIAEITLIQAVKTSLTKVKGKALKAELENENGFLVYGVEIVTPDKFIMDVKVDAGSGKVLKIDRDSNDHQDNDFSDDQVNANSYNPEIIPAAFTVNIDNPYFSLKHGTTFIYKSKTDKGIEINKVVVTDKTRKVMGVNTRVVWDRVWLNDELKEETDDWYAQDGKGNVWYFGEDSKEYENGKVGGTKGSWEAGINNAMPGIIMKAKPQLGKQYRQEYFKGEAEDMAEVVSLNETVSVPYGLFDKCVKTKDWTPLEPDVVEHKYYAPGIGVVLEVNPKTGERSELVEVIRP